MSKTNHTKTDHQIEKENEVEQNNSFEQGSFEEVDDFLANKEPDSLAEKAFEEGLGDNSDTDDDVS